MNSTVSRIIVSASSLAPIIDNAVKTKLNFLVWAEQDFELYDGMIESVEKAGFHVVAIRNSSDINYELFNIEHSIKSAKQSGQKVAVFFNDIHRYEPVYLRFIMQALCDKVIGEATLDADDVICATSAQTSNPVERHVPSNMMIPILNRFCNFRFKG